MMSNHRLTAAAALATILTSVGLYPIFTNFEWFYAGAGAVITVALVGTLTRRYNLHPLLCLIASAAGILLYLNLVFEATRSIIIIPTPDSIAHLWQLAGQGLSDASQFAPPVPALHGILVLAAGGIGLTAAFTDLLAVRLRWTALAGLPLLLLFTEPFMVSVTRDAIGTFVVFFLAAAGYLSMLSADGRARIGTWGHAGPLPDRRPDTRTLAATGRRVGVASVVVALCVPLFVPGLHETRLFGGGWGFGGNGGSGSGTISMPDPFAQLHGELIEGTPQEVMRYTSTDLDPGYLQVDVLDQLTATGWTYGTIANAVPVSGSLPAAPGLTSQTPSSSVVTHITLTKNFSPPDGSLTFLPLPYPATRVQVPGAWTTDPATLMTMSRGASLAGLSYTVTSLHLSPTPTQLGEASSGTIGAAYLNVPASYDSLQSLAESVTQSATTPFAKATALQQWLSRGGHFTYTLDASQITDAGQLQTFLTDTKRGYCQQFAFAMAVLARLLGIPSRMAIGFTQGTRQRNGTWLVMTTDAHAWPELYFQGAGWLQFEPTPAGKNGQGTAQTPPYTVPIAPVGPTISPSSAPTSPAQTSKGDSNHNLGRGHLLPQGGGGEQATIAANPARSHPWVLAGLSLLGLLFLAVVVPGLARLLARRRRWWVPAADNAASANAAWRELRADLTDYHVRYQLSESPRALATRITSQLRLPAPAGEALGRVAMAAERAQYSAAPAAGQGLRKDSATVRRAIAAATTRRARWRARFLPASVLTPTAAGVSRVVDTLGWINLGGLRHRARRHQTRP
jgi:transglutaminase-like putative cysteine protease